MMDKNKVKGMLWGLVVGDAFGSPIQFCGRDSHPWITEMVACPVFDLPPGYWTDDSSMAMCETDDGDGPSRKTVLADKGEIRRRMRERRRALTPEERAAASEIVCAKLAADSDISLRVDPLDGWSPVAVYLASPQEIDLSPFIREMLATGVKVVAPRWNGETYELAVLKGLDDAHLRKGPMGILEPAEAEIVSPKEVDVWLVPGLAFTRDGKRLGYGGGWYDRLLAGLKDPLSIGIAHAFQVVDDLPGEPHDVSLAGVVDDSLEHELVEFATREDGFSAHVGIPKLGRRRRNFVLAFLGVLLSPAMIVAVVWMAAHGVHPLGVMAASIVTFIASAVSAVVILDSVGGPVEALIEVSGEKGVCWRRFLGILPLPPKRFRWTCWSRAVGTYGFYSAAASSSLSVFEDGVEYRLFKTESDAATRLSMRMNRAKRPPEGIRDPLFTMLPARYKLPLRLFVESALEK